MPRIAFLPTLRVVLVMVAVLVTLVVLGAPAAAAEADDPAAPVEFDAGQGELQASAVAAEDRRLTEVRTATSLARWRGENWKTPYRLGTESGYNLVLTPRASPYTVEDLLALAPQTFLQMSDGTYLLTEHLVVMPRATLELAAPGGLDLRLASGPDGFATVMSLGGELLITGEEGAEVTISSWDPASGDVDTTPEDGRAYVRAVGGQFEARYVDLSHLGFWSGRTGGLALTGTDRPNTGAIESIGPSGGGAGQPSVLDGVTWQPAGPLQPGDTNPALDFSVPDRNYVSAELDHVTVERNAFGLFVSGANGIQVSDSSFEENWLGGVVMHRYVNNGTIVRTTSARNAGDGFTLARATTGITISESTAAENTESGFRLNGRPLADGPSAVGASLRSYGNNSVDNSTATDNGRYGIDVSGGVNVGVQNNEVAGHEMGIMVNGEASGITITGNTVRDSERHGIALVNGVTESSVTGNLIDDPATGVYVRDSSVEVRGNTVQSARSHGVSVVGDAGGSEVSFNALSGSGASALDLTRSNGEVAESSNNVASWSDTTPWYYWFKKLLQPMNALWALIALFVLMSAIRSRGAHGTIEHPYAHQMAHRGHLPVPGSPVPGSDVIDLRHTMSSSNGTP